MLSGRYINKIILSKPIDKGSYLSELPAVRYLKEHGELELEHDVTFFVGENGTGKSTLIEAIAIAYGFNAEGGTRNFCFSTVQSHSELWRHLTLAKSSFAKDGFFLRAESFFNVATKIDEMDSTLLQSYGGTSLHRQSHGESFLSLVQNRFGGNGLYILDEPEAALSPMSLMTLIVEIDALVKQGSQFIIATHSPILMAFPGSQVFLFSEKGIEKTDYRKTEHYQITRYFLENPEKMFRHLLG